MAAVDPGTRDVVRVVVRFGALLPVHALSSNATATIDHRRITQVSTR
jgi:hypothetical protein